MSGISNVPYIADFITQVKKITVKYIKADISAGMTKVAFSAHGEPIPRFSRILRASQLALICAIRIWANSGIRMGLIVGSVMGPIIPVKNGVQTTIKVRIATT